MWVLVRRIMRINILLAQGRSRGLFLHEDFKDRDELLRPRPSRGT